MPFMAGAGHTAAAHPHRPETPPPGPDETMPFIAGAGHAAAHPQTSAPGPDETMPFVAGAGHAAAAGRGSRSDWFPPASSSSSGVGGPAGKRQPFGGPAAHVGHPPAPPADPTVAVPQQRAAGGTVYGGGPDSPIDMTMPVTMSPLENSGSLTGHILAQGWDHGSDDHRRSNVKVGIVMLIILIVLIVVSLVFLLTAGSALKGVLGGL
jgi:hypothetical protein